jgi:aspartate ammonia-lyase
MRIEHDSYGAIEIADNFLFGAQTARCLNNLTCSPYRLSAFPELIEALALVKKAAALANKSAGVISANVADHIENACDQILAGGLEEHFPVDMLHGGGSIAFNQNINEVIANLANINANGQIGEYAPVHPREHVNASQSTADSCATASRLAIINIAEALVSACCVCADQLDGAALKYHGTITIARTCLQDAMLVDATTTFTAWSSMLRRCSEKFKTNVNELLKVNLGGTVIGSGEGAASGYQEQVISQLSEVTGLPLRRRDNLYDAAQNIDDLGAVSKSLELLAQSLIKMAGDIRLLSSGPHNGFGEITVPSVQDGSSFFRGKVNPVVAETLMQACFHVIGSQRAAGAALEHGELNLNVFESCSVFHILESTKILTNALNLLNSRCLNGLELNTARCEQMVQNFMANQNKPMNAKAKGKAKV